LALRNNKTAYAVNVVVEVVKTDSKITFIDEIKFFMK